MLEEPYCGNSVVEEGEYCDDGNEDDSTNCLNDCSAEALGYHCYTDPKLKHSICVEVCGDGVITENEDCEDGNLNNGDGCDSTCLEERGWACCREVPSTCTEICGDGLVVGEEGCDSGVCEECDNDCKEAGEYYTCVGGDETHPSICTPICGDGEEIGDECEDGNFDNFDGCSSTCELEEGWESDGDGGFEPICGDGL